MLTDIKIEGLDDILLRMERLRLDSGMLAKHVKMILRKVIADAKKKVRTDAHTNLPNDPRRAYAAIRYTVWRILGGNVNILARRRNNGKMYIGNTGRGRLRPGQHGGNRMKRSKDTERLYSYYGSDRGFILRFLNSGTSVRTTKTTNANRGSISARNWFGNSAQRAMEQAAGEFSALIDRAIKEVWNDMAAARSMDKES